jgi:hypothetical protein
LIENINQFKEDVNLLLINDCYPHKDINYFRHRFFEHPVYQYMIYKIIKDDVKSSCAFFACREIEKFGIRILRIVDYIGSEECLAGISLPLQDLMEKNHYEYVDCYCYGISEKTMNKAGLLKHFDTDKNIIPNYFEPFTCENINILFYANNITNLRIFKADADQDQPRLNI